GAYLNRFEFVAAWLALKVVGNWPQWRDEATPAPPGRNVMNAFISGTGISLFYGVVGGSLIHWLQGRDWNRSVTVPVLMLVGSEVLTRYARCGQPPAVE